MKQLEILVVSHRNDDRRAAADLLTAEGLGVTTCLDVEDAERLLREVGLAFDAMLVEGDGETLSPQLQDLAASSNMAVLCMVNDGQEPATSLCDVALHRPFERREVLDALHYALNRHGQL